MNVGDTISVRVGVGIRARVTEGKVLALAPDSNGALVETSDHQALVSVKKNPNGTVESDAFCVVDSSIKSRSAAAKILGYRNVPNLN